MASAGESACSLAALILHDDGIPITAEKIVILNKAANVSIESCWPTLFAKLFEKPSVEDLITNVGTETNVGRGEGGGAPVAAAVPVVASGGAVAAAPPLRRKRKRKSQNKSDDEGFNLFD